MPRSGGVFTLVPGYFATDGTAIEVSQHNPPLEDIAQALTDSLPRDGSAPMTGNLPMGSNKITGLAAGTNASDAVRFDQVPNLTGLTATVTELNYTDGVTSPIQTQLNAKQATITTLPLANGGTGAALVDPNADRLLFWDDSAGAMTFLTLGTGLTITGTTITASGGLGVGQTWQDVSGSRAFGTSYQNTTGVPITFNPRATSVAGSTIQMETSPDNSVWTIVYKVNHNIGSTFTDSSMGTAVVPDTFYYRCRNIAGTNTLTAWMELRP